MGMSQMCTGAGDYFTTSKPHSEKLWGVLESSGHPLADIFKIDASWAEKLKKTRVSKILSPTVCDKSDSRSVKEYSLPSSVWNLNLELNFHLGMHILI